MMVAERLSVLHIIASVDRKGGGPVQALIQTIENLPSDQSLETISLDSPDSPFVRDFPGTVHCVGPGFGRYGYTSKISRWIKDNSYRFDAAVIHGLWNHASIGGWLGCRKSKLPYVVFTHGMMDPWFRKKYPIKHIAKQVFWAIQGRVLKDASSVIFTCEEEKRLASGVFFGFDYSPRVVAFAAPDAMPRSQDEYMAFQSAVPRLAGRPYLLFLSRIHEKKGCDLLIQAFAKATTREDLQLVMAGPEHGALGQRLRRLADTLGVGERVHWAGMIQGISKAGAFRGAEAFVLTSHQENFGIAIAEALAYAKPVLITDKINIWREVEAGGGGIVAPDTIEGAVQLISAWENMSFYEREIMGRSARLVYENFFTIEAAVNDLTDTVNDAVIGCGEIN